MAAPETNTSVILAKARARADEVLSAFKGALDREPTPAAAAYMTATIEPLTRAVAALSQALAASVGYSVKTPTPPGTKAK
jgi:hypothetical protein